MIKGRYPLNSIGITQYHHNGKCIDFGWNDKVGKNQPIYSYADGIIKGIELQPKGGNVIYIEHKDKTVSIYAHLSKIFVKKGQKVKLGDKIGNMGETGVVSGAHLHFGIANNYIDRYKNTEIDVLKACELYEDQEVSENTLKKYKDKIIIHKEHIQKTTSQIVQEVIEGKWGNGKERKENLQNAGYNYYEVQDLVNDILFSKEVKSNKEIAQEVIEGKWGNGANRKKQLELAGFDYNKIQEIVNSML